MHICHKIINQNLFLFYLKFDSHNNKISMGGRKLIFNKELPAKPQGRVGSCPPIKVQVPGNGGLLFL